MAYTTAPAVPKSLDSAIAKLEAAKAANDEAIRRAYNRDPLQTWGCDPFADQERIAQAEHDARCMRALKQAQRWVEAIGLVAAVLLIGGWLDR